MRVGLRHANGLLSTAPSSWSDVIEEAVRRQAPIAYLPLRYAVEDISRNITVVRYVSYEAAVDDATGDRPIRGGLGSSSSLTMWAFSGLATVGDMPRLPAYLLRRSHRAAGGSHSFGRPAAEIGNRQASAGG